MTDPAFRHLPEQLRWRAATELNPVETMFWRMEPVPGMRPNLLAIVRLDRAPDWDRLVARHEWLSGEVPWLHQRVVEPPLRMGRPFWVEADHCRVERHLRRVTLPAPGADRQLLDFAQTLVHAPFEPTRPLWEAVVVEGLAGGKAAYLLKVHHSVTDGLGAAQFMFALHA